MKKVITIEGMSCGHCEMSVKNGLSALEGVLVESVSKDAKEAVVETTVADDVLKDTIEGLGFDFIRVEAK